MAGCPSGEGGSVGADYLHKLIPRARHTIHPSEIPHVIFIQKGPHAHLGWEPKRVTRLRCGLEQFLNVSVPL